MKKLLVMVLTVSVLSLTSCASVFSGTSEQVTFNSEPQGAEIWVNAVNLGTTPTTVSIRKTEVDQVVLKKEGYRDTRVGVRTELDGVTFVNILFWPGFIVDYVTGAINDIQPRSVNTKLEK